MTTHQLFSDTDKKQIESLVFDASLEPRFNALSACLTWEDELPSGITIEAYDVLSSLWFTRSLMHQGLSFADHPINPEYCEKVWQQAIKEIPAWPGFKRLALDEKAKAYFSEMLKQEDALA